MDPDSASRFPPTLVSASAVQPIAPTMLPPPSTLPKGPNNANKHTHDNRTHNRVPSGRPVAGVSTAEITTIEGIVDWIIAESGTTVEQGDRFERLMYHFFRLAPVWHNQFNEVWLWKDWPGNNGETDHGIDLVAKNREDDGYTAIQAKCYARTTTLNKPEVDSFISASGGDEFTRRIMVATTYHIGDKALKEMERQTKPVQL